VVYFVVWLALARWLAGSHTDICTGGVVALVVVVLLSGAVNYLLGNALDAAEQPDEERPWRAAVADSSQGDTSLSGGKEGTGAPDAQESPRGRPTGDVQAETTDTVTEAAPTPADESSVPAECAACDAWNPPGSVYCGECGAGLGGEHD
jgi:hypothetical protein